MAGPKEPFFIGFSPVPAALRPFLIGVAAGLLSLFAGIGWLVAASQSDPGGGAFRGDWGPQTVTGVVETRPYPVLHVIESGRWAAGATLLLAGQGKTGAKDRAEPLAGRVATARGIALTRGDLAMLQLAGGDGGLEAAAGEAPAIPRRDLGRWRLTGEICDGKCYAGAMRPGAGLAHKACANLCIVGGTPPVFVATDEIEGTPFFLMGASDGGPIPDTLLDVTGVLVEAEGRIERRGGILLFLADPESVRRLP